jgi:hypothetical protein
MTQPSAAAPGAPTGPGGPAPAGPPGNGPGEVEAMYHQAVTGKKVPADDRVTITRLRSLVRRFGSQTAAARAMGVGRSTLGGWLARRNKPSAASLHKVTDLQRKVRQQDAAEATYGKRGARLKAGATLRIEGIGGPTCTSPEDALRDRDLGIALGGAEAQRLMELMAGNDAAALDYMQDLFADKYMQGAQPWEWSYVETLRLEF